MTERQAYWLGILAFITFFISLAYMLGHEKWTSVMVMFGCFQFGSLCNWLWYEFVVPHIVKNKVE